MASQSYVRPYLKEAVQTERSYDPRQAVQTATTASWAAIADQLKQQLSDYRGQQVGMGRLNTGFATEDEDRLYRQALKDQANITAQNALQGESLYQTSRNRYLELLSGEDDRFTRDQNLKRQKRGGLWGTLLGLAGAGVGLATGGVPGAMAGWSIGSGAGSAVGSL